MVLNGKGTMPAMLAKWYCMMDASKPYTVLLHVSTQLIHHCRVLNGQSTHWKIVPRVGLMYFVYFVFFCRQETVAELLEHMFHGKKSKSALVNGVSVLLALLEFKKQG